MIAALYARVSSKGQEQEATIESQLAQLLAFAQNNGHQIPAQLHFIDEAVSGSTLRREGLDRLRNAAASGQFNLLLCLAPDRLARNLGVQQLLLSELNHFGVEVIFTTQPMRGETPNDQLLLNKIAICRVRTSSH